MSLRPSTPGIPGEISRQSSHIGRSFTPDGYNPNDKKAFKDNETLLASGIRTDPIKMLRYVVRWDVDPHQPVAAPVVPQDQIGSPSAGASSASSSGIVYRTGSNYSAEGGLSPRSHNRTPSDKYGVASHAPPSNEVGVEVRMFSDGGIVNVSVTGRGHQFSAAAELSVPESQFGNYTWGALKRRLGSNWPKFTDGGHTTGVEKHFTDGESLADTGIAPSKDGKAVAFQVAFTKA